jgi:signal transduction histidine kinase
MDKARAAAELKAQELELANRYKSEFLTNISHELRTPLNSLLILAELLVDNKLGNLNDKQVEYAKTIHSSGTDLLNLINEILDLAKVEAGKIEVHHEDISLADFVETLEHKFKPLAEKQNLAFQITLGNDLPTILRTDKQRLTQIINNLLSNAFKFTSQGEVRLQIEQSLLPMFLQAQQSIFEVENFAVLSQKIFLNPLKLWLSASLIPGLEFLKINSNVYLKHFSKLMVPRAVAMEELD